MSIWDFDMADAQHHDVLFALAEICERCGVRTEVVVEMVEFGILTPVAAPAPEQWQFTADALLRLHRAQRLRQDLELNLPGLALSLDLLDQIDSLQQQVVSLQDQLQKQRGQ